ncbi:2Fe-2S iron-sulfur cluster-binding protein [Bdellovibrio bacteriovorus]|uniref:2Fe-2S iron-sulfur cluster-binding protein n=1 Tax=Bdellovibrio bacteriovorus TaxID=959 RepID=UPI000AA93DC6|nr:2Fe-2S iron-sulfur cluster-binding protein [Bdellovibrio bacteriovorus]
MKGTKSGIYITFLPDHPDVPVSHKDETVLEVALRAGIKISHTCGGNGTCGTCLVHVRKGLSDIGPRNEIESEMAEDRKFLDEERLACQTPPIQGLEVEIRLKE